MSGYGSMQYTIGTALDRAREQAHLVEILVEGEWLAGLVVALDGQGVVLENEAYGHSIVRLERIAATRVNASFPSDRRRITEAQMPVHAGGCDPRGFDGAMPMPSPRVATH